MEIVIPITAGGLIAVGLFLMLRRQLLYVFVGLVILAHGVNVAIFTSGGLQRTAPVLEAGQPAGPSMADPLPQAMILTAIVIGMAVQAFLLVLVYRLNEAADTRDQAELREAERAEPEDRV